MWFWFFLLFLALPKQIKAAVPSPSIPSPDNNIPYVGAFYMPGFKIGTPLPGWRGIENFDPTRKPLLGYFDEGNPETMDWEIKWALENGINFFIFDWFRCGDGTDVKCTGNNGVLGKPITPDKLMYSASLHEGFLKSQFQNQMKFAIMLTTGDNTPIFSDENDLKNNLLPFIINNYLKKSNYLKINNRPLLFFYGTDNPNNSSGYNKIDSGVIRIIRDTIKQSGLGEPYLIAEDRDFTARKSTKAATYKTIGYDHVFSYWPVVYQAGGINFYAQKTERITEDQALTGMKESYNWLSQNQVLPFIANANPMADGINQPLWTLSPPKYENLIDYLKSSIVPNIKSDLGKKVIITDAWNEITEGHWIAPTEKYAFNYLKSIRNTLTKSNNNPDYRRPLENGFGPYDSQYQNLYKHVVPPSLFEKSEFSFNNENDYRIADKSPTGNTEKLSFGAWFYSSKPVSNFIPFIKGYGSLHLVINSSGSGHCALSTNNTAWYPPGGGTTAGWNSSQFKFGEWHHLFCVYDGNHLHAYVDGQKTGTSTLEVTGLTTDPYNDFIFGKNYQGKIAKLKIAKVAYTPAQVKALYESTIIIPTPTSTPIPTSIPSPCTQCPGKVNTKLKGDADCSGTITLNDYSIWRSEYHSGHLGLLNKNSWYSDYNCNGKADLTDALIWRINFSRELLN